MYFTETGLSAAEVSSLFAIWSVAGFLLEIPSSVWADRFSRRRLLVLAPLVTSAGFALWTFVPSYWAFAAGFVLWGAGSAMQSGTLQALVYEELGRAGDYARLIGRSEALASVAAVAASLLAAPVLAAGGYLAVGLASVAIGLLGALTGRLLPESHPPAAERAEATYLSVLRTGLSEVRRAPAVGRMLVILAAVTGLTSIDEYLPLLAAAGGAPTPVIPLLVGLVIAGIAAGGWLAGYGARLLPLVLAAGALALGGGAALSGTSGGGAALSGTGAPGGGAASSGAVGLGGSGAGLWAGFAAIAVAFAAFYWAVAVLDARLQDMIGDEARATVTSMAGLGSEVAALGVFAFYGFGSGWAAPWVLVALVAVPYLVMAVASRR
ncbi:MFS transporter [Nonomuraea endophytica]|uniref:MFS family permease n=1 Tax=Nonomuraea endophytica TaxID=714136 RepID=A0A7W8A4K7_9ACTN|nr:MFS family permease [Nonomuraea endophytica]